MTQDEIFKAYYVQYRAEADTPNNLDDEYIVFVGLANEAINRWAKYDNTFWKELYTTLQISGDGENEIDITQDEYGTADDMQVAGGKIRVFDPVTNQTKARIPIIEPQDVQFQSDLAMYAYFIGDPNNGFTLKLEGVTDALDGMSFDYVYYKKPTVFTADDSTTANDTNPEMSDPYFIVHRSLANRFRGSRNPYYQSAKNDAEDALRTMQLTNNSGNWADPWSLPDNSNGRFGV
jgi:hypothetical protein